MTNTRLRNWPIPFTTSIPLPSADELRQRIPKGHPRIGFRPGDLEQLRRQLDDEPYRSCFASLIQGADDHVAQPLPKVELPDGFFDPRLGPYDGRYWRTKKGFEQYRVKMSGPFKTMHGQLRAVALAYRLTDDPRYLERALHIMDAIAGLDPKITAYSNTHLFHGAIGALSVGLDYLWDELEPARRERVIAAIVERALEFHPASVDLAIENPLNAHAMSYGPGTMVLAALALYHHAPVTEWWLSDILLYLNERFPGFGGDDGGYAQGFGYGIGIGQAVMHLLKIATGIDFFRLPWMQHHPRFILYFQPPYSTCPTFGDASGGGAKSRLHQRVMQMYAGHLNDPYCQWYAEQIDEVSQDSDGGLLSFHYHCPNMPQARPPDDLPQAAHFADVGWVAMHSHLADRERNVMMLAKSSPYGSFNHSHADQNSFVLEAYSRPLLIDSGYYPWYGSPHDSSWYKQTRAHNAILINGKGQGVANIEARGRIIAFENTDDIVYTVGDATVAYQQPSLFSAPLDLCAHDQQVVRAQRHFVFIRPDLFVILDDIETTEPAAIQFLLHALYPFEVDQTAQTLAIVNEPAMAKIHLLGEDQATISQTDQFTDPPEAEGGGTYPNQWHATCDFAATRAVRRLLTVIQIARTDETSRLLSVEHIETADVLGAKIGETTVQFDLTADPLQLICERRQP